MISDSLGIGMLIYRFCSKIASNEGPPVSTNQGSKLSNSGYLVPLPIGQGTGIWNGITLKRRI